MPDTTAQQSEEIRNTAPAPSELPPACCLDKRPGQEIWWLLQVTQQFFYI